METYTKKRPKTKKNIAVNQDVYEAVRTLSYELRIPQCQVVERAIAVLELERLKEQLQVKGGDPK